DDDEPPKSVIHAPPGFGEFTHFFQESSISSKSKQTHSLKSRDTAAPHPQKAAPITEKRPMSSPASPPQLATDIAPVTNWSERATPRAQTRQEFEDFERTVHLSQLEDIPEGVDVDATIEELMNGTNDLTVGSFRDSEDEITALRTALSECWTLCNTLANLSYIHRERLFNFANRGDKQEQAWKSCWKLCQKLYDWRDDDYTSQVSPTLDLCRDFCQALFDVRTRDNEVADSVLRVSFELNNHLYNTHDRDLPEAFRERTLDFYITLCHRLMKQRMHLAEETDSLLQACWSLAEMLFSIRQNRREGKMPDEQLLGSAVQACWELCDLFREGWTQIRPDRGTPRPSQTPFMHAFSQAKQSKTVASNEVTSQHYNPETPTTIFEDTTTVSPDEAPGPNLFVLGQGQRQSSHRKWSSNSSTLSGRTKTSEQTSSTNTVTTSTENPDLARLRILVAKAAFNSGYQRTGPDDLSLFVKSLSSDAFGSSPWQVSLLGHFKKLVISHPAFRVVGSPARAGVVDIAKAVETMAQTVQYAWLKDLYRFVFGFHPEEAESRRNVIVQT
ncbi:hypothetical protein V8E54_007592, partial [Elaphomyces granulatus]